MVTCAPILRPGRLLLSSWPWRSALYLLGYLAGGLVSWVSVSTVVTFPVWASAWVRLERRLAGLVGGEPASATKGGGVTWRELVHCLLSAPLTALGVIGAIALAAGARSTLLAGWQAVDGIGSSRLFPVAAPGQTALAVAVGVAGIPLVMWLVSAVAVGVEALSAGILAPRAEALARQVSSLRAASLRAEDDLLLERRLLQQQLHDGAQLHLSVTGTRLAVLEYDIEQLVPQPQRAELLRGLGDVRDELQAAMGEVRNAAAGLAPRVLIDQGLCAALRELAGKLPVELTVDCAVPRLPEPVETDLYLIISEALTNVVKHARARSVTITLRLAAGARSGCHVLRGDNLARSRGERGKGNDGAAQRQAGGAQDPRSVAEPARQARAGVTVTVRDDGAGGADVTGRGILGMAARAERIGGTVTLDSPPGQGTAVLITLPEAAR